MLKGFQRFAARRLQRLHPRSINSTCICCLGWLDIIRVIKGKKLIFIRTIAYMEELSPLRRILVERLNEFDPEDNNNYDSPIIQILKTAVEFNLLETVQVMFNGRIISKVGWKKRVWEQIWTSEREDWAEKARSDKHYDLVKLAVDEYGYSIWWKIADNDHGKMRQCETMVKLITHASLLKGDDGRLRRKPFGVRACTMCELHSQEDTNHMIMQCPAHENSRISMYNEINEIYALDAGECTLGILLGRRLPNKTVEEMLPLWLISSRHIYAMYKCTINNRRGIG